MSTDLWRTVLEAAGIAWFRDRTDDEGIAIIRANARGESPISRALAKQIEESLGIPVSDWPQIGRDINLSTNRRARRYSSGMESTSVEARQRARVLAMAASNASTTEHHSFRAWLVKIGKTPTDWARENDYKPGTVSTWMVGSRSIPRSIANRIVDQSRGEVPVSAWKKVK